jgi:cell wall-associated NlpC family hydrolase
VRDLAEVINRHIGRPWCAQGFDCWAFVRAVYDEAFGILLPVLPGVDGDDPTAAARAVETVKATGVWRDVPRADARAGDAVTMGKRSRPHHCGIWVPIDGGLVAHCDTASGVCCQSLRQLASLGWGGITFHRHHLRADP